MRGCVPRIPPAKSLGLGAVPRAAGDAGVAPTAAVVKIHAPGIIDYLRSAVTDFLVEALTGHGMPCPYRTAIPYAPGVSGSCSGTPGSERRGSRKALRERIVFAPALRRVSGDWTEGPQAEQ